jgi:hypothetical protein
VTTEPRPAVPPFVRSVYPPLAIMAVAAAMFFWSLSYDNETAREVPLLVSAGLFVLAVFDLVCRFDAPALGPLRDFWGADFRNPEMKHHPRFADEATQVAWMVACVAGIMLIGILPTVPIFVLLYMTVGGRRRWLEGLIVGAVVLAFVYGIFELLLDYRLYRGALIDPRGFEAW